MEEEVAGWGMWGSDPPCEHLLALRAYLEVSGIGIWGELTEGPKGWVNVWCEKCQRTYEVTLRPPFDV